MVWACLLATSCAQEANIKPTVSVGGRHTCFLTIDGAVKCWGNNIHGELGYGSNAEESTLPVDVSGLTHGVTALATGGFHNCAITPTGVMCWGENEYGELGDGTTDNRNSPVKVIGLSKDIIALAAGESFSCALSRIGRVSCWGENRSGELGDGTTIDRSLPSYVKGLGDDIVSIAASGHHTCALTRSGSVKCWGIDIQDDNKDGVTTPEIVSGVSNVMAIATGGVADCALIQSGTVRCWGDVSLAGDINNQPTDVPGLPDIIIAITGGDVHFCVLSNLGDVMCWGDNEVGQLGIGSTISWIDHPMSVPGLGGNVISISAGGAHTCAMLTSLQVKCWGWNGAGQLGDGTTDNRYLPVDVIGLK
jgi:alpha-tubulin suppressor-like RCC1 family protein